MQVLRGAVTPTVFRVQHRSLDGAQRDMTGRALLREEYAWHRTWLTHPAVLASHLLVVATTNLALVRHTQFTETREAQEELAVGTQHTLMPGELLAAAADDAVSVALVACGRLRAVQQLGALQVGVAFHNLRIDQPELFPRPLVSCGKVLDRRLRLAARRVDAFRTLRLLSDGQVPARGRGAHEGQGGLVDLIDDGSQSGLPCRRTRAADAWERRIKAGFQLALKETLQPP